jgi:hypothetical protein
MRMHVVEFERESGHQTFYALGVTFAPRDRASIEAEFDQLTRAAAEWRRHRGASGDVVQLTFVAAEDLHDAIEVALSGAISSGTATHKALAGSTVMVSVLDLDGQPKREGTIPL